VGHIKKLYLGLIFIKAHLVSSGQILQSMLMPVSSCSCKKFHWFSRASQATECSLFWNSAEAFPTPPCCFTQNATSYVVFWYTRVFFFFSGFYEYYITGIKLRMQCFYKQYLIIKKCQCKYTLPKARLPLLSFSHMMPSLHEDRSN